MTPKEKAKELFDKYVELSGIYVGDYESEKEMCLIAVDEILIAITFNTYDEEEYIKEDTFWNDVKQEIEKL